jgi:redox-sensitive bicupin YhaK (pirin superfamily)
VTVDVRRAAERFVTRVDGIEQRHCFSFGEHYDPDNVGHGALLVSNDELLGSGAGFDDHPHADAEIVTWVLSGSLVHEDSTGHRGVVYPGLAQRMSAGRGIVHAERNDVVRGPAARHDPDSAVPGVHYVQMWVRPDESGTEPSYAQREVDLGDLATGWVPVVSGHDRDAAVTLGARDCTLWATVLTPGVPRLLPAAPLAHLYLARGELELETVGTLRAGDSVRLTGEADLSATTSSDAELLVWQLGR